MSGFKLHSDQLRSGFVVDAANSDGSETRVTKTAVECASMLEPMFTSQGLPVRVCGRFHLFEDPWKRVKQ